MTSTQIPQVSEIQLAYKTTVSNADRPHIGKASDAYDILKACYDENMIELREEFIILLLNRANKVLGKVSISTGCTAGTMVDVKFIFASAVLSNSSTVIISHNHPSGRLDPSAQDRQITKRIKDVLKLADITLIDHLIVTKDSFFSFADEGLL